MSLSPSTGVSFNFCMLTLFLKIVDNLIYIIHVKYLKKIGLIQHFYNLYKIFILINIIYFFKIILDSRVTLTGGSYDKKCPETKIDREKIALALTVMEKLTR